jgi:hypothetical protein
VERSEFELPVPASKLPDDSIMLSCDIETSCEALPPRTAFVTRCRFVVEANGCQSGLPSAAESVAVLLMPHEENASLERRDSNARTEWSSGP